MKTVFPTFSLCHLNSERDKDRGKKKNQMGMCQYEWVRTTVEDTVRLSQILSGHVEKTGTVLLPPHCVKGLLIILVLKYSQVDIQIDLKRVDIYFGGQPTVGNYINF
jgi:hypothetical protein